MRRLTLLAAAATVAAPFAHASTIQTSTSAFAAAVGSTATTATIGNLYDPVTTVRLVNGNGFTINDAGAVIDQPGMGVGPFANGYTGQVIDSSGNSETLTFVRPIASFGLTIQPDVPIVTNTPASVTFTVRLGDGTTTSFSNVYRGGAVQFVGFSGGPQTSLTITASGVPDFSFGQFLTATAVPEPASLALLSAALLALPRRRRSA